MLTADVDHFVVDRLPPPADWPDLDYSSLPYLADPSAPLNCAAELLDRHVLAGHGLRPAMWCLGRRWTYVELCEWSNRIAASLVEDLGVRPGHRVLLRGFNSPWLMAAWFAVLKAGGVVVTTMPLLRAR